MINPFVICSTEELAVIRQYADRQVWELQCQALGATIEQAQAWDKQARAYAATTVYPSTDVVAYLRRLAREALARGELWPESIEATIEAENRRQLMRRFPPGFFDKD